MNFSIIPVTPFQQNCSLLVCKKTRKAAVIDPGGDSETIVSALAESDAQLEKIFLTHGHLDHVGAAAELAARFGVPVEGPHYDDQFWLQSLPEQCRIFGFAHVDALNPSRWLEDGDAVNFGAVSLQVLHCPGHTPGHVVYYSAAERLAWVGDVLFKGAIGRTDFPRGNYRTLLASIADKLWPLGTDVAFVPGHGPMSTFGEEMRTNPFVAV